MTDFLLELACEEIPARMQAKAAEQLAARFAEGLKGRVTAETITAYATPRRLALLATGLPDQGAAVSEERRGPRADAPAAALEGFLRSTGLTRDQLEERETPKGVFLYAQLRSAGQPTATLLAELLPTILRDFDWPKSMRWGPASIVSTAPRWVRPLTGIVALFGETVVPFEFAGLMAGRHTRGHRFMSHGPIEIAHPRDYAAQLRDAHVILDPAERRDIILTRARALATEAGLTLIEDDGLASENAGLTEWPVPLLGKFDPAFLDVPPEVIQLTMRTNQKYFAASDAAGKLAPAFIAVANITASDGGAAIAAGNARVLSARLSDAKFFWETDAAKVRAEGLGAFNAKLGDIVFHEKLGTLADKVDRVAKLARWLAAYIPGCDPDDAELAARLCKADLTTGTVGEFPEVQGLIGGYLARIAQPLPFKGGATRAAGAAGVGDLAPLPQAVADAIRDHYKPVGQSDDVPTEPVSVAVALADKLDTLIAFFAVEEFPSGSRDPYALRRAALGINSLLFRNCVRLSMTAAFDDFRRIVCEFADSRPSQCAFRARGSFGLPLSSDEDKIVEKGIWRISPIARKSKFVWPEKFKDLTEWLVVLDKSPTQTFWDESFEKPILKLKIDESAKRTFLGFLADRLKVQQREAGVRHDLIDAVFALGGEDDLVRLLARVHALQAFLATDDGANLLAGYRRAANILAAEAKKDGVTRYDAAPTTPAASTPADAGLAAALAPVAEAAQAAIAAEDFGGAMAALAQLRAPIDGFFDAVMVNDPDPALRHLRLALLQRFTDAVHAVADFAKVAG